MSIILIQSTTLSALMNTHKLLIIEDDPVLNSHLGELLSEAGYTVDQCEDGDKGLELASSHRYHLILLDIMLPHRDGLSLLRMLRKTQQTPVILITAKGAEEERIRGFSQGADDYVTKPFNSTELLLRIEALLRRSHPMNNHVDSDLLRFEELEIDRKKQSVFVFEQHVEMTPIEFKLIWVLALQQGEILSKAYLNQLVLNRAYSSYDRSLDMHLSRVRRKLNGVGWDGARLQTVHGKGYVLS